MIDVKPALRFLKLDIMGEKCAEVGKNIAAFAKHHRLSTTGTIGLLAVIGSLLDLSAPSLILDTALVGLTGYLMNGAGKYDRKRDELDKAFIARAKIYGFAERRSPEV